MNETKATRYQRLRRRARAAGVVSGGADAGAPRAHAASRGWSPAGRARSRGRSPRAAAGAVVARRLRRAARRALGTGARCRSCCTWRCASTGVCAGRSRHVDDVLAAQLQATAIALPAALVARRGDRGRQRGSPEPGGGLIAGVVLAGAARRGAAAARRRCSRASPRPGRSRGPSSPRGSRELARARPRADRRHRRMARGRRRPHDRARHRRRPPRAASSSPPTSCATGRTTRSPWSSRTSWRITRTTICWRTLALDAAVLCGGALARAAAALARGCPARPARPGDLAALPLIALVAGARLAGRDAAPPRAVAAPRAPRRSSSRCVDGGADAFGAAIRRLSAQSPRRGTAVTR